MDDFKVLERVFAIFFVLCISMLCIPEIFLILSCGINALSILFSVMMTGIYVLSIFGVLYSLFKR